MKPLLLVLIMLPFYTMAQRISLINGDLKALKGQTSYNIKFNYDSLYVGRNIPEKDFLKALKARWDEKDSSKSEELIQMWFGDRQKYYEPVFIKEFEKSSGLKLKNQNTPYTILLKTRFTEGGWNVGVAGQTGEIGGELWIVESADNGKIICKIKFYDSKGDEPFGGDFDMTRRILTAYKNAGKWMGYFVRRKSK